MIIYIRATGKGRYDARTWDGHLLCQHSRQPLLDAARALLPLVEATEPLLMRREDTDFDALRSTVGEAAKLTVAERDHGIARFERWVPNERFGIPSTEAQGRP